MDCWFWMTRQDAGSTTSSPTFKDDFLQEEKRLGILFIQGFRPKVFATLVNFELDNVSLICFSLK